MVGDSVVRKRKAGTAIRACGCSLSVARQISVCLCRQACPSIRMLDGLIAQKAEAVP